MGDRAAASDVVQNTAEATRQFALELVRSSGSESGMASGATTGMRKRSPSQNRRVGIVSTASERVRKTSVTKRTLTVAPRGRP
eukprot:6224251-Heterocapsa_arctica.AAC.1